MEMPISDDVLIRTVFWLYGRLESFLGPDLTNFFVTALGIAVYAIILGTFYNNFSKRKFFELEKKRGDGPLSEAVHIVTFAVKYTLAFPLITFIWFLFLTIFMVLLGSQSAIDVMYISIAVVAAIRISAYWDEGISADLAKMLPLGLLAVFIGNPSFLDASVFEARFYEITKVLPLSIPYLAYIILLEWSLRILLSIKEFIWKHYFRKEAALPKKAKAEDESA